MSFWRAVWVVARKELRDNVRDTRVRFSALALPLMGPLFFVVIFSGMIADKRESTSLDVVVSGAHLAPDLVGFLNQNGFRTEDTENDVEALVRTHRRDVGIRVHEDYGDKFLHGVSATVELYADGSDPKLRAKSERVSTLLRGYSEFVGMRRLLARGVSPSLASPLRVELIDVATPNQMTARALSIIPMFLLIMAFVGGMHVASDTTAGERERGSLEPLLLNPASRGAILAGKWAATSVAAAMAVSVCLCGFFLATQRLALSELGIQASLHGINLLALWGVMLSLVLLASSLQLCVSLYARSNREAQTYLQLLLFLPMTSGVALTLSPLASASWMMVIPLLGHNLLAATLIGGDGISVSAVLLCTLSTCVLALLIYGASVRLLKRESTVFGRSS